jgi:hypothetical protein
MIFIEQLSKKLSKLVIKSIKRKKLDPKFVFILFISSLLLTSDERKKEIKEPKCSREVCLEPFLVRDTSIKHLKFHFEETETRDSSGVIQLDRSIELELNR